MIFSKSNKKFKKGFSIGEVLLSAFILGAVLIVMIQVLSKSLGDSMDARDSIIASGLSQEGVELIRNLRDNNWTSLGQGNLSFNGTDGLSTPHYRLPINSSTNCIVDQSSTYANCSPASNLLYYSGSYYMHSGTSATKFRRRISLTYNGTNSTDAQSVAVVSMVVWDKTNDSNYPSVENCNIGSQCVYTEITLSKWEE